MPHVLTATHSNSSEIQPHIYRCIRDKRRATTMTLLLQWASVMTRSSAKMPDGLKLLWFSVRTYNEINTFKCQRILADSNLALYCRAESCASNRPICFCYRTRWTESMAVWRRDKKNYRKNKFLIISNAMPWTSTSNTWNTRNPDTYYLRHTLCRVGTKSCHKRTSGRVSTTPVVHSESPLWWNCTTRIIKDKTVLNTHRLWRFLRSHHSGRQTGRHSNCRSRSCPPWTRTVCPRVRHGTCCTGSKPHASACLCRKGPETTKSAFRCTALSPGTQISLRHRHISIDR